VIARRPHPPPGALTRARALLLTLAVEGDAATVTEGAARLEHWQALATICDTDWLPTGRHVGRPSPASLRVARRRLRLLGSAPTPFADIVAGVRPEGGDPVHLRGVCARLPGSDARDELWRTRTVDDAGGRWLIDEGHDFLLTDPDGAVVQVLAAEGRLLGGPVLRAGEEASVFGFLDHVPDAIGRAPGGRGRGGLMPALRGDPDLPLLVALFGRYAEEGDHPK
jgi:hypothetical protein